MPQLRLTTKMAKELKILKLKDPNNCTALYDDWYVDVVRILRKKIFIFMHIHTRIALAIPSYEIGGIHNLFKCSLCSLTNSCISLIMEKLPMNHMIFSLAFHHKFTSSRQMIKVLYVMLVILN